MARARSESTDRVTRQSSDTTLAAFVHRQPAADLAEVLLELAGEHEVVAQRLTRMQLASEPRKLAASFRKTLAGWQRSRDVHGYRESRGYGQLLESWLDQVARELAPHDPQAALALYERFIEADSTWFEQADDSDGHIGDAVRAACRHWLRTAALCDGLQDEWSARLTALFLADDYGAREELLRSADLLLSQAGLRALVADFESRLSASVAAAVRPQGLSHDAYKLSAALSLLSEALRDPGVMVRAVLCYSPDPNPVQRQSFARAYLDADRPDGALAWLQASWEGMEQSRLELLAQALERLERFDESLPLRQQIFEHHPDAFSLARWLEHLPEAGRADALAQAHATALGQPDPITGAALLLALGDAQGAENQLMAQAAAVDGARYGTLVPLAAALRAQSCWRGESVVYRALLRGILDRAYARSYSHAAHYWVRLRQIAHSGAALMPLQSHEAFEAEIRARHPRKTAFWTKVRAGQAGDR